MIHPIWKHHDDIEEALVSVKHIMISEMSSLPPDIKTTILDYINASGKYLRAGLCLYLEKEIQGEISQGKLYLAAAIETFHLATLIHDDVIDEAELRRNIKPLHQVYSNKIAIYAGDYLLSYAGRLATRGAQLLNIKDNWEDNGPLPYHVVERILAGELAQLMNQHNSQMTMKAYLKQIKGKTAFLFGLACQLGTWYPKIPQKTSKAAYHLGIFLGMAFQLSDDLIDYRLRADQSGKPRLQDVQNGIYTAPLILGMAQSQTIKQLVDKHQAVEWKEEELTLLYNHLLNTQAFEATEALIEKYLMKISQTSGLLPLNHQEGFLTFIKHILARRY
ncbi:polyprenyl synthetase family protein [Streptococcus dysgalactiae subsp. equisimilis]|uniref:polyprenyl synthetase family protein n=1 Tax=Streptococcus dysgalactiae TaxID=1334 RepID=UPI0010CAB128|nr:polyprenyl synthetase family protein [Streptococcus dysgalactiae]MCL6221473.1 polyprenyl synthetase family protein [Streptococcus dysgalactiae subsp. equisimilis]MDY2964349.1 polyprenyl synthetase family protein [Streptococcus dysgalactiae]MEC4576693.1 polyprenyl synthetase family protein [Streptococcus dysgalactiae]QZT28233.1 polyprenyl synthetase family protein [Streptococcus dysgalactiae]UMY68971.1 polyprenyl synthetase family protein [Streptococcus dysgalactiae subsp. equisimilis]